MPFTRVWLILLTTVSAIACQANEPRYDVPTSTAQLRTEGAPVPEGAPVEAVDGMVAVARLHNTTGNPVGLATFKKTEAGILIRLEVDNLPPGPHGLHIHERGLCEPPGFESAGGHFNPKQRKHGLQNLNGPHAGDLPNLNVNGDGKGSLEMVSDRISLEDGALNSLVNPVGTSVVVHAGADDQQTDPSGDSGERIACGVVEYKREEPVETLYHAPDRH